MPLSTPAMTAARWSSLRLRQTSHLRDLCAETSFTLAHLIQPIFVVEGLDATEAIPGLDGNYRYGLNAALDAIAETLERHLDIDALIAVSKLAGSDAAGNGNRG